MTHGPTTPLGGRRHIGAQVGAQVDWTPFAPIYVYTQHTHTKHAHHTLITRPCTLRTHRSTLVVATIKSLLATKLAAVAICCTLLESSLTSPDRHGKLRATSVLPLGSTCTARVHVHAPIVQRCMYAACIYMTLDGNVS